MSAIKQLIIDMYKRALRVLIPTETITHSQSKWDDLARKNARYYVLSDRGEKISEQDFRTAGKRDYQKYIGCDELVRAKLFPFADKKVLEIGAGIGRITEFIAEEFQEVTAIDISTEMVIRGKKRLRDANNVHYIATNGISYPFSENTFDFIFSFIVFQHMPSVDVIQKNLYELGRVLKPSGIAKIQLRGVPTNRTAWFYGPAFTAESLAQIIGDNLSVIKTEGAGTKYYWVWVEKKE